uniref:Exocyst complex component Sec8 n=1 Tax=Romanomermis culicivorax TaxID=13658 RepID=A0A915IYI6_ROMCU
MTEIREYVELKLKNIFDQLLREIDRQIYIKPSEELLFELKRINSMRKSSGSHLIVTENESAPFNVEDFNVARPKSSSSSHLSLPASLKSLNNVYSQLSEDECPILMDDGLAYEDISPDYNPENNYVQYIAILLESLGVVGRLSQAVDSIKESIPRNLSRLTQHIAMFVHEHYSSNEQNSGDNRLLNELLQLLFRQFKSISTLHGYVINQIKRVQTNCPMQRDKDLTFYQSRDLWVEIQSCLKSLLNDYLDVNNNEYADSVLKSRKLIDSSLKIDDWSKYFSRKRPQKSGKLVYFRFADTANAIENKAYNIERRLLNLDDSPTTVKHNFFKLSSIESHTSLSTMMSPEERFYVCRPDPENVTVIFKSLMRFIIEIESRDTSYGQCCPLRSFHQRIPILSCVLRVSTLCKNFESLAQSAPAFLEPVAELWLQTLWQVVESAEIAYEASTGSSLASSGGKMSSKFRPPGKRKQSIVFPAHEKRKVSASWAVDEDISRLLKSLPNWLELLNSGQRQSIDGSVSLNGYDRINPRQSRSPDIVDSAPTPLSTHSTSFDDSVQEIRSRNQRESELLISNLEPE